ncbi:MAG: radical SAM protein [Pseudomonadota bacterium]
MSATEAQAAAPIEHQATSLVYSPEENPYRTVMVDITHRCNMECRNCYIPNRHIPDMDADWLIDTISRFPQRTHIRLVGAEPTVRKDLPDLVRRVREAGHLPMILSNGLKLANRDYVRKLKQAGLRTVYLSFNGGFDDDAYEAIDDLRCANRKAAALDSLCAENMYISLGVILARDVNEQVIGPVFRAAMDRRAVRELHLRSIGPIGRYMETPPLQMAEMVDRLVEHTGLERSAIGDYEGKGHIDFAVGGLRLQITQWPDLESSTRGRLAPDGTLQPAFEHVLANEGGY